MHSCTRLLSDANWPGQGHPTVTKYFWSFMQKAYSVDLLCGILRGHSTDQESLLTRWYFVVFEEDAHPQQSLSCGQGGDEGYLWSSLYFLLSDQNTALNSETKPCLRIFRIATQEGQTRWERQGWPFENFDCRPEPWWCRKAKVWPVHL